MNEQVKQAGFTLIELLVTILILGILTVATTPYFTNILQQKDLQTAKNRIVHSLQKAKKIANAENTFVDVRIADNLIQLSPKNRAETLNIKIPARITTDIDVDFTFNANGGIYREGGQTIDSITNITINPKANPSLFETITITNTGLIASL